MLAAFEADNASAGWSSETYGTHRWIVGDPTAARVSVGSTHLGRGCFQIEDLPTTEFEVLSDLPLVNAVPPDASARMQAAADLIATVDDLAGAVLTVVCSAHVLNADRGYDVSHSTPELPLSIFVSVPDADEPHAVARLAESIIHEAMHLQLTLIESLVPLVQTSQATAYSPWKQSQRPVGGALHGLYVFAVISEALGVMARSSPELAAYVATRQAQIEDEVRELGDGRSALTPVGVSLWERLAQQVLDSEQRTSRRVR